MGCTLTSKQREAFRKRFAAVLDLRKEFVDARNWVENIHRGRPYKSFSRFFWNWCRRSEEESLRRAGKRRVERVKWDRARVAERPVEIGRAELIWAALNEADPRLREFAQSELERIRGMTDSRLGEIIRELKR